jgi:hypothetical protein
MRKLPFGEMGFREMITDNLPYADKTGYIHTMLQQFPSKCLISRPSGFGKTLLLDTVRELFSGDEELFKGLAIETAGYQFPRHPVISLSMAAATPPAGTSSK